MCWGPPDGPINVPSNRLDMNARVAAALSAPVLMVLDAPSELTVEVSSQPLPLWILSCMYQQIPLQAAGGFP